MCGLKKKKIYSSIKKIKNVDGRLELIKSFKNNIKVFVDYAHTPGALETVLKSIKNLNNNKISLVFGCGGERDKQKRSIMAKIAKNYCQKIYVTDDNPRNENPDKIRSEITNTLREDFYNIANRTRIKKSILNAQANEIILC